MKTRVFIIGILSIIYVFLLSPSPAACATSVHLAWDASEGTVTGYRIYYDTTT